MVDMDSQKVCARLLNLVLTGLLIPTWLIWNLRRCVVASRSYQLHWWPQNGWFWLLDCASLPLQPTHRIADSDMVDLNSQEVRGFVSNMLTELLTPRGWLGFSESPWFAPKYTPSIADPNMINLDSQLVRGLPSNLTRFLTPRLIWYLRWWMVCSRIFSLNCWPQHSWFWSLSECVVASRIYSLNRWLWHGWYGLSGFTSRI